MTVPGGYGQVDSKSARNERSVGQETTVLTTKSWSGSVRAGRRAADEIGNPAGSSPKGSRQSARHYEILEPLGAGGMGEVRARQPPSSGSEALTLRIVMILHRRGARVCIAKWPRDQS